LNISKGVCLQISQPACTPCAGEEEQLRSAPATLSTPGSQGSAEPGRVLEQHGGQAGELKLPVVLGETDVEINKYRRFMW